MARKKAKRANSAVFFYLAALTFVNVPGVSRIAVKVKALFWLKELQRVPVPRINHGPPRFAESPEIGAYGPPDDD